MNTIFILVKASAVYGRNESVLTRSKTRDFTQDCHTGLSHSVTRADALNSFQIQVRLSRFVTSIRSGASV